MTDPVTDFLHQAGPSDPWWSSSPAWPSTLWMPSALPIFDELAFHPTLAQFTDWQAWRYVTPAFIHFSVLPWCSTCCGGGISVAR